MLNSIEVRPIFFTNEILDFSLKIPSEYKYHNGTTKYILKKLLLKNLTKELVFSKKKGFGVPVSKFFLKHNISLKKIKKIKLCKKFIRKIVDDQKKKIKDNKIFLWSLLILLRSKVLN